MAAASSGVPQGSVLGPLLFLIYVNDLAQKLHCPCYMFADDVKIVGCPQNNLMQQDLEEIHRWTVMWELPLNAAKCKQLLVADTHEAQRQIGEPNSGTHIERVTEIRDLGIQVSASFKVSSQCIAATRKANRALYQLKRTMASREPEVLLPMYKVFVRPHLEYCVQAWSPYLVKDKQTLERVQRRFTKLFVKIRKMEYSDRLRSLDLFSLERRRMRGDLIETFKILKGLTDSGKHLFSLNGNTALRGHEMKLAKPQASNNARAHFFSCRVVNAWNKLPSEVVATTTVTNFKNLLDKCWRVVFPELV